MFLNPSGLKDIIAVNSNLSFIDGDLGKLLYRGIDVKDLVHKSTFEESIYLLWYGRLPKKDELETFTLELCSNIYPQMLSFRVIRKKTILRLHG